MYGTTIKNTLERVRDHNQELLMERRLSLITPTIALGIVLFVGCAEPRAPGPGDLLGRWDLAATDSVERWPLWLELTNDTAPAGRFQPRGGHALPIEDVVLEGTGVTFGIAERELRFEAVLLDTVLSGTVTDMYGGPFTFTGVRAPTLARTTDPEWGDEIDLLADGLTGWDVRRAENGWSFTDGVLNNSAPSSDLISHSRFTDFRLHVEVNVPSEGNSGIYLRGRHEVQVQDDYGNEPHSRRMGGIYGQVTPTVLPAKPAGEWQAFDITLIGRRVTVVLNGVTMIENAEIPGITGGALDSDEGAPGPIMLQGDHTGIQYRNIRITPARSTKTVGRGDR
jgi:hypothetical protein